MSFLAVNARKLARMVQDLQRRSDCHCRCQHARRGAQAQVGNARNPPDAGCRFELPLVPLSLSHGNEVIFRLEMDINACSEFVAHLLKIKCADYFQAPETNARLASEWMSAFAKAAGLPAADLLQTVTNTVTRTITVMYVCDAVNVRAVLENGRDPVVTFEVPDRTVLFVPIHTENADGVAMHCSLEFVRHFF